MRYARLPERAFTQIQGLTNMYASVSSRAGEPFACRSYCMARGMCASVS
jgi:hypothetical protein